MPIYDYACKACSHEFEREQRISEAPVRKCPACGKHQAKRLISRTSFLLKGGGWYSDLYASSRGGGAAEKAGEGGGEAEAAKGDGAKAEKSEKAEKSDKAASAKSGGEGKSAKKPSGGGKAAA